MWSRRTWFLVTAFALTEFAANWLAATVRVPVGPTLIPGGSFLIPVGMLLRDELHENHPHRTLWVALGIGLVTSVMWSGAVARVALASVVAFTLAFLVDTYVYRYIRSRRGVGTRTAAMRWSNWASLPVDTLIFVPLAFAGVAPLGELIPGQLVVKLAMTEVGILGWRWLRQRGEA